ncbi:F0F1 ATP synthase subunit A [Luteipulveratus sp. YIM 133132]|uniref:ATP synthase subunit a n=1 Tax=Luteipulveratus flavus TaxID=3031728 RepID=A0ABT6C8B7_9MICO|nr:MULTISPECIES: F0F1 ATP synthase subunit A [unclassified Luteipulveratus]MDE9365940.1 F0F1 ATP synthase subunit A [Luteipulveratus sp. YIM 133132]MDF8265130.1 F0F1 ATP synthase subunit A [Luteipulveratus sp. YIM 133296]
MSYTVLAAVSGLSAASDSGDGFEAPTPEEFYQPLFGSGDFSFTRPMALFAISAVLIAAFLIVTTRKAAVVPGKGQWITEQGYNFVRNGIAQDIIGSKEFLRYVPLLFTLFCTILVNNLFGVIPPFQYPTMGRVGFPIALALLVYVIYQVLAFKRKGVIGYLKSLIPDGLPTAIVPLILFLEIITYFVTRPVTLALRLFGNMFAGHLLLLLFILGGEYMMFHADGIHMKVFGAGSYILAAAMTVFEILIEALQAYIFTMLAATYIADSLSDHH